MLVNFGLALQTQVKVKVWWTAGKLMHRTLIKAPREHGSTSMAISLALVAGLTTFKNRADLKPGESMNH